MGAKEYHKVTLNNKAHTRDLLIGKNTGGWLPQGKIQQRIEQEAGFIEFLVFEHGNWGGALYLTTGHGSQKTREETETKEENI